MNLASRVTSDTAYGPDLRSTRDLAVDVWYAQLSMAAERLPEHSQCLSSDEQVRAARFHFDQHRARFIAGRGLLRHLLSRYLDEPPERIRFGYGPQGKPFLLEYPDLRFNLSHAADVLLVAVAQHRAIGVDVEPVPSDGVVDSVSGIVFSAPERSSLLASTGLQRRELFARLWTRKEAYIKAEGQGMSLRLDCIDVSTSPDRVLLLNDSRDQWLPSPHWTLRSFPPSPSYAASVAAEGPDWQSTLRVWPPDTGETER